VALARALVIRPKCLLLDEPLSNLDAKLRNDMRAEIRRICKDFALTTVYVTHDQKEALSVADRMAVFSRGELHQVGSPVDIYRRPRNRFVADFIGEANFLPGKLVRSEGPHWVAETPVAEIRGVAPDGASARPGDPVEVMIRPETLALSETNPETNAIPVRVTGLTYYGEVAHYELAASRGEAKLRLSEINPQHLDAMREGELHAFARPEDVVILAS